MRAVSERRELDIVMRQVPLATLLAWVGPQGQSGSAGENVPGLLMRRSPANGVPYLDSEVWPDVEIEPLVLPP